MQCPRCKVPDRGVGVCSECGMTLDPFRCSVYSSILRFEPGHAIGNDYAVIELLGSGLTGITFKVTDLTGGEIFILKFVTVDTLYRDNRIKSFAQRLKKLASSPHPAIGEVRKVVNTEYGFSATVSEIIAGEDLARRLAMNQEFDPSAASRICREIAEGIAHAHALGILHRNLRPSNVILTPGESIKIIDFCIPAVVPSGTHPVAPYIAPEVLEMPEQQDQKSDIYSIGAIFERLLTGAPPGGRRTKIPARLRPIVERATHPEPGERYDQVDELIAELIGAAVPEGIALNPLQPGGPRVYVPDEDSQIRLRAFSPVKAAPAAAKSKAVLAPAAAPIAPAKTVTRPAAKSPGAPPPKPAPPAPARPPPKVEPPPEPVPEPVEEEALEEPLEEALEEPLEEALEEEIIQEPGPQPAPRAAAPPPPQPAAKPQVPARPRSEPPPPFTPSGPDEEIKPGTDDTGQEKEFPLVLQGHKGYVHSVSVSPDGKVAVTGASDSSIRLWKLGDQTGEPLPGHRGYVYSVQFGRDPQKFYSVGMDGQLKIWSVANRQEISSVQAHQDRIFALGIDSTRMRAYTAGMDGKIKMWTLDALEPDGDLPGHPERVYSIAVSRDGRYVATGSMDKMVKIWDAEAKKEVVTLRGHKDRVYFVLFTPDGKNVISASMDETIQIWDVAKGKIDKTLKGHSGHVYTLALSNEGRYMASGSMDKTIKIWQLPEGNVIATGAGHEGTVSTLALTPSSRYVVSGSYDSSVRIWDMQKLLASESDS